MDSPSNYDKNFERYQRKKSLVNGEESKNIIYIFALQMLRSNPLKSWALNHPVHTSKAGHQSLFEVAGWPENHKPYYIAYMTKWKDAYLHLYHKRLVLSVKIYALRKWQQTPKCRPGGGH
jgi:hypothetical protein